MQQSRPLDSLDREELLQTTRKLLAEADALSSRISALNEIGLAVNQSLDLERIERVIAKQAKWLLDFDHCSVCLKEGETWHIKTLFGEAEPPTVDMMFMPNLAGVMFTTRPLIVDEGSPSTFLDRYQSQIIIPLSADQEFLGTINFACKASNQYSHDDMRIGYMLSLQLASAIRNANVVKELKATREELKLRVEELDAYGHTIAHDLKSPLSSILLRSQIFERRFLEEVPVPALEMVKSIEDSSKLMNRMIDQLLLLAKLRQTDQKSEKVDIRGAVNAALERFSLQIETKSVAVSILDLPDACGQAQWIEEVFANLLSNAIKYMGEDNPHPSITIQGKVQETLVRYEVRDSGIGVKEEDQGKLFEMFSRVHQIQGVEGIGIGLSIVQRIIRNLGGEIGLESVYGEGTTFWFTLPAAPPDLPDVKVEGSQ